jgi:hypothetical protein
MRIYSERLPMFFANRPTFVLEEKGKLQLKAQFRQLETKALSIWTFQLDPNAVRACRHELSQKPQFDHGR